jgi:8-oxo-dGTP diphosphatase
MAKSSKLVAVKRGKVLLVRRRSDHRWMFPGGRKRAREVKELKAKKRRRSGRKMSDAIFVASKAKGI